MKTLRIENLKIYLNNKRVKNVRELRLDILWGCKSISGTLETVKASKGSFASADTETRSVQLENWRDGIIRLLESEGEDVEEICEPESQIDEL